MGLKDRHLYGAGAAACAVCCAAPVLTFLGIAGAAAATVATLIFAGLAFGLVVGAVFAVWEKRRRAQRQACVPTAGPVDLGLSDIGQGRDT